MSDKKKQKTKTKKTETSEKKTKIKNNKIAGLAGLLTAIGLGTYFWNSKPKIQKNPDNKQNYKTKALQISNKYSNITKMNLEIANEIVNTPRIEIVNKQLYNKAIDLLSNQKYYRSTG
jgi:uncharacterized protein HemX